MQLIPLYEKVVILMKDKQEIKSVGGIVLQKDMSQMNTTTMIGTVVATGEGRLLQDGSIKPLTVKVGDEVLFTKMTGESYNDGEYDYTILSESNILAILNKEGNE